MLKPNALCRTAPPKLVCCVHVFPETTAVSVTGLPEHSVVAEAVITGAVGNALTVTVLLTELLQVPLL